MSMKNPLSSYQDHTSEFLSLVDTLKKFDSSAPMFLLTAQNQRDPGLLPEASFQDWVWDPSNLTEACEACKAKRKLIVPEDVFKKPEDVAEN